MDRIKPSSLDRFDRPRWTELLRNPQYAIEQRRTDTTLANRLGLASEILARQLTQPSSALVAAVFGSQTVLLEPGERHLGYAVKVTARHLTDEEMRNRRIEVELSYGDGRPNEIKSFTGTELQEGKLFKNVSYADEGSYTPHFRTRFEGLNLCTSIP